MKFAFELPVEVLREYLHYNAKTGVITWRKKPSRGILVGSVAGTPKGPGNEYLVFQIKGTLYRAHRVAWALYYGEWPPDELDHKNRQRADNRIKNLRLATRSTNAANGPGHLKKRLKGTGIMRNGKWSAQIGVNRKKIHLGCFHTEQEAHDAYVAAAEKHFGAYSSPG